MRHTLQNDAPADGFADCYLLGNGALGAAVHGRPGTERLDLNLDTLWSGGPAGPGVWCGPGDVAPLCAAVAAGDHRRADELARALQSDRWVQAFQPSDGSSGSTIGPRAARSRRRTGAASTCPPQSR